MKRILVAVDGSDNSQRALDLALDFANKFGAQLTLTYVVPPVPVVGEPALVNLVEIQQRQEDYGAKLLRELAAALGTRGIRVETKLLEGPAAEAISAFAEADHSDLVAIGSRGRNAVARVLLGSVSSRLIHLCKSPVLVVH